MQALAAEAINKLPLAESERDRQHRTFSVNSQSRVRFSLFNKD